MKKNHQLKIKPADFSRLDFKGLRVAIIGGTGGIGQAMSRLLAGKGASVIVVGQTFRDANVPGIEFIKADLSLMSEAQRVAKALPAETLDVVIFTTGIMAASKREVTADNIERDLAVSYLNRLVISREISPRLGKGRPAGARKPRVFNVGFPGTNQVANVDDLNAEKKYAAMAAHGATVAGNEVMVIEEARRFPNVNYFGLNPGFVKTNIRANLFGKNTLLKSITEGMTGFMTAEPEDYAKRVLPLLLAPELENQSTAMFNNKGEPILPSPKSTERAYALALTTASEGLIARAGVRL